MKSEVQTCQPVEMIERILFLFSESFVAAGALSKLISFSQESFLGGINLSTFQFRMLFISPGSTFHYLISFSLP